MSRADVSTCSMIDKRWIAGAWQHSHGEWNLKWFGKADTGSGGGIGGSGKSRKSGSRRACWGRRVQGRVARGCVPPLHDGGTEVTCDVFSQCDV
jgi:hypothetical protein